MKLRNKSNMFSELFFESVRIIFKSSKFLWQVVKRANASIQRRSFVAGGMKFWQVNHNMSTVTLAHKAMNRMRQIFIKDIVGLFVDMKVIELFEAIFFYL